MINNAGIVIAGPIELLDIKKLKEQFDVNTFGAIAVTQKFLPLLKDGKIINISSMASHGLFPYISPYCASKRAMDILFNSFALENKDNIKVCGGLVCLVSIARLYKSCRLVARLH